MSRGFGRVPRRVRAGGSGVALSGTVAIHMAVGWVLFGAVRAPDLPEFQVYSVNLVAAPRPQPQARRAPAAVQREARAEPRIPVSAPPRRTSQSPTPPPPQADEQEREPAPRTTPDVEPAPGETPSTGNDPVTVKVDGAQFPFPGYLRNVVAEINRRWNRPQGNVSLRAEVLFFIRRDGSITNIQFVQRSGDFRFDLEAQGAIEAAGNVTAFGPLPDGYTNDVLPVRFYFDPASLSGN